LHFGGHEDVSKSATQRSAKFGWPFANPPNMNKRQLIAGVGLKDLKGRAVMTCPNLGGGLFEHEIYSIETIVLSAFSFIAHKSADSIG
jgi:hypothetical protein